MKFFITGGAGFIGSHIAQRLLKKDPSAKVVCYDNLSVGPKENIPQGAVFIKGDILDKKLLIESLKDIDVCFHLAAFVSIRGSYEEKLLMHELQTNEIGTLKVLDACVQAGVKRCIFASSMAVYGEPASFPVQENSYIKPNSPYGLSKLRGEIYGEILRKHGKIEFTSLRFFNTYGVKQTPSPYVGVITTFINQALAGKPLSIYGDGNQLRDFIWVEDVADACVLAAHSTACGVYNVGSGKEYSVNQIAELVKKHIPTTKVEYVTAAPGEIQRMLADISKIQKELGFKPKGTLEKVFPEIVSFWKAKLSH